MNKRDAFKRGSIDNKEKQCGERAARGRQRAQARVRRRPEETGGSASEGTLPNARRTVGAAHRPHALGTLNQPAKFLPPA
jgi:hypothetical protein